MKNWIILSALLTGYANAFTTVMDADALFEQQQYQQAKAAYEQNIEVGSPHAYYQLGYLYFKGLGIEQNIPLALIYFSLAAEYQISDSAQVVEHILTNLPEGQRQQQELLVAQMIEKYGRKSQQAKLFPEIISDNLSKKITLNGEVYDEDWFEQGIEPLEDELAIDDGFADGFEVDGADEWSSPSTSVSPSSGRQSSFVSLKDRPYFAVLNYQIAQDGSVRDIETSQKMGYVKTRVDDFGRFFTAPVQFEQKPSWFVGQQILGIADMSKFEINDKYPNLYSHMRRVAQKLRASNKVSDQFQLAMALMRFKFLAKTAENGVEILKHCAEQHWPAAQYAYGLYLYREQIDVTKGIEYISLAAQYGYEKANYQLGAILQHSPWVKQDIHKALFWYERAAQQNSQNAKLRAAYLRLIDDKQNFYNATIADQYLADLSEERARDPEYHFIRALSYRDKNNRQLKLAFEHMRKAISLAADLNWDTTEWENLYANWTEGRITVVDDIHSAE